MLIHEHLQFYRGNLIAEEELETKIFMKTHAKLFNDPLYRFSFFELDLGFDGTLNTHRTSFFGTFHKHW